MLNLPEDYIKELRDNLGLKLKTKSKIAYDIFYELNRELFKKCKHGDYTYLMLDKEYQEPPKLPQINRQSWETGFMLKLNRNPTLINSFNRLMNNLPNRELTIAEFSDTFFTHFDKKLWTNDIIDVIYFLETIGFVLLNYNIDGNIKWIKVVPEHVRHIKNFNNEIIQEWNRPFLEDFYYYVSKIANKELRKN